MVDPKPGTPEFGVRAAVRKAKVGKDDLAPMKNKKERFQMMRRMLDALLDQSEAEGKSNDASQIENRINQEKLAKETGETD